ncbi:MAG TPA: hypothetical protein PLW68_08275 [Casimicrobiaceae bacterium]|nr:hypothetical protein [Casimicrobiaceae bacterium]
MDQIFSDLPIWGVFLGTLLLVVASVEAGYVWARRRQRDRELEKEAPVGAMVGATLGLLAFLLAFTFGIAADAFHARKVALVEEVNAIRMTYLLSSVIPEVHRSEIRTVLREYVDERLRWASGKQDEPGRSAKDLLDRLWKAAAVVGEQSPGQVDVFLRYVGRIIELQQERLEVRERSRIPGAYWAVLYVVAVLALTSVGYHGGVAGTSRSPVMLAVAIAFSAVIMVIADLDRPGQGFINVSQQPLVDLRAMLVTSKP